MSTAELCSGSTGGVSLEVLSELKKELAATIEGLPYLFARSTYSNELTLHFGSERGHTHSKLQGKVRGSHILSVRGSAWLLQSGVRPVLVGCGVDLISPPPDEVKPFNVTALESGALIGPGATVARATPITVAHVNAIVLRLDLDDGSVFTILPTPPGKEDTDLPEPADWELLTPSKVLRVGPGPNFSVERF